jgi:hypothetical protein
MPKPGLLGFLLVIIAAANVITAIAALIVAVQVWNLDISGGGSMSVNINGRCPFTTTSSVEGTYPLRSASETDRQSAAQGPF